MSILLVEKNPDLRKIFKFALERDGHVVKHAETGEKALSLLDETVFDVIVTAMNIGEGMSAVEFRESLAQKSPQSRVILVTGCVPPPEVTRKFDAFFLKPLRIPDLLAVIESVR